MDEFYLMDDSINCSASNVRFLEDEIENLKGTLDTLYKYVKTRLEPECDYCIWRGYYSNEPPCDYCLSTGYSLC